MAYNSPLALHTAARLPAMSTSLRTLRLASSQRTALRAGPSHVLKLANVRYNSAAATGQDPMTGERVQLPDIEVCTPPQRPSDGPEKGTLSDPGVPVALALAARDYAHATAEAAAAPL